VDGHVDPNGTAGGPVIDNDESKARTWTTYPERLEAAGISWRCIKRRTNYDDNALAWSTYRDATRNAAL